MGFQIYKTVSKLSWRQTAKGKVIYILDKASELIKKWLEESCGKFESEEKYLTSMTVILEKKLILQLSILLLLMNFKTRQLSSEPLHVDFDVGNESVTEFLQKKIKENFNFT